MGIEALAVGAIGAGLASGGLNYFGQHEANRINQESVASTNALNKELWMQQAVRDDNAVQRRKADLLAAGLNPNLAAGSAAVSSAAPKMEPAQVSPERPGDIFGEGARGAVSAIGMDAALAQRDLTRANVATEAMKPVAIQAQTARDNASAAKALAEAGYRSEATKIVAKDAELYTKKGIDVRDRDMFSKTLKHFPTVTENLKKQIQGGVSSGFSNPLFPSPADMAKLLGKRR